MVNASELKKLNGNVCLYLTLHKSRQRTFLERNIQQTLNERAQGLAARGSLSNHPNGMETQLTAERAWTFPDATKHEAILKKRNKMLKIDVRGLKRVPNDSDQDSRRVDLPRKRIKELEVPCQLEVVVWAGKADPDNQVHRDVQPALIKVSRNEHHERLFDIDLENPFIFEESKLISLVERGDRWKRTWDSTYVVTITINFMDMEDAASLSPYLDPEGWTADSRAYRKLSAKWPILPSCPKPGVGIELFGAFSGENKRLGYDLNADIGWIMSSESPLESYNRILRKSRTETDREPQLQLPSPISEAKSLREEHVIIYSFKDSFVTKALKLDGYQCVMCNRKDYHSLDRLHFHLKTCHELFKFTVDKKESESDSGLLVEVAIDVYLSDQYEDGSRTMKPNSRSFSWVAPKKSLNVKEFVNGKAKWTVSYVDSRSRNTHSAKATVPIIIKCKEPDEVQNVPLHKKKKYRVPKSSSSAVIYFRTTSKRPLQEGEYLSESDDNVSEDWLRLRTRRDMSQAQMPDPVKRFLLVFDSHMQDELLSGESVLSDSVVRFARLQQDLLAQPDMAEEFLKKVSELHEDRLISSGVLKFCQEAVRESKEKGANGTNTIQLARLGAAQKTNGVLEERPEETLKQMREISGTGTSTTPKGGAPSSKPLRARDDDGDVVMEDDAPRSHLPLRIAGTKDPDMSTRDTCICGQHTEGLRGVIWCANPDCDRHAFHSSCVGLSRRIPDWRCRDCR